MTFTRDTFTKIFSEVNDDLLGLIVDALYSDPKDKNYSKRDDEVFVSVHTDNFYLEYSFDWEELTITRKSDSAMVNWYKLYHVGRALQTENLNTKQDLRRFLEQLAEELEEYMKSFE